MDITHTHPAVGSNTSEQKLPSREEIFQELARKTCKVIWTKGRERVETSGCFVQDDSTKKIQVLSCFHDPSWATHTIQIIYQNKIIDAKLAQAVSTFQARHDLCTLDFEQEDIKYDCFVFKGNFAQPNLGQKIYFSGFPFGTEYPLVHKGYVSSVQNEDRSDRFTINGTVVPGHSGGPIVLAETTELQLLGTISSQLCDISKEFLELSNTELPSIVPLNDVSSSYGNSNVRAVLKETMDCIFANFSTGIGKATSLTNMTKLKLEEAEIPEQKKEATCTTYGTEKKTTNFSNSRSFEDRSASTVFEDMEKPDPWMQRHGIGGSSLSVPESVGFNGTSHDERITKLPLGKTKRTGKNKKYFQQKGDKIRKDAISKGAFKNVGLPSAIYRFVSVAAAKDIKKNGIVHTGTELDGIPFISLPKKTAAQSIGAVSPDKMVTVYPDMILGLSAENVEITPQQNSIFSYKLNISIPKEAIEISEA